MLFICFLTGKSRETIEMPPRETVLYYSDHESIDYEDIQKVIIHVPSALAGRVKIYDRVMLEIRVGP